MTATITTTATYARAGKYMKLVPPNVVSRWGIHLIYLALLRLNNLLDVATYYYHLYCYYM